LEQFKREEDKEFKKRIATKLMKQTLPRDISPRVFQLQNKKNQGLKNEKKIGQNNGKHSKKCVHFKKKRMMIQ